MRKFLIPGVLAALVALTVGVCYISRPKSAELVAKSIVINELDKRPKGPKNLELRSFFTRARVQYEYDMLKDPVTGRIPLNYRREELAAARLLPQRIRDDGGVFRTTANNTYQAAGPTNVGGRTRAVAFDRRYGTGGNQVIIAGGVSGGIFRSANGGGTWTMVSPEDTAHNVVSIVQDPRPGSQDTWYAGGGEAIGASAEELGALYLGFGLWKSTNNGQTWSKLNDVIPGVVKRPDCPGTFLLECFDHPFDMVHKIVVNPVNGHVYVASHRRLVRSVDGGANWTIVFDTNESATADVGQTDIVVTTGGTLYFALNGGSPDVDLRGVWSSLTGNAGSWTRRAGGNTLGTDSALGWRGNDFNGASRRIVMALAPSDQNTLYVTYENGQDHSGAGGLPEADLFRYTATTNTWTNLSVNVPDFPGQADGIDPFNCQFGYNLMVAVHPTNPNMVFMGGVNLFRSTSGFTNNTATTWIGGYRPQMDVRVYGYTEFEDDITRWSHPDIHALAFDPSNPNRAICANDGGLQITENITANPSGAGDIESVTWTVCSNYQTLQYYRVTIDPEAGRMNFAGGAQDNGTRYREGTQFLATPTNNNQYRILSGDGGAAALAKLNGNTQKLYCSAQYGDIRRITLQPGQITGGEQIKPNGLTAIPGNPGLFGEFVTNFKLDQDNTEDLYYVNWNRLFRTTSASTVSATGWTELTAVGNTVDPNGLSDNTILTIRALELSRGPYFPSHVLYIGTTGGRVYRLNNPRAATASTVPVDITPSAIRDKAVIVDIASNPNNDEEIMIVASNYTADNVRINNIWWTNNAKAATPTWRNIEGNLITPSIRSCAIIVKKDGSNNPITEYYVGTSVGLYSSTNVSSGTTTWAREGGNVLNYAVISSLAYRPQDNILLVGTHGNGMFFADLGSPDFRPNQNTGINDPVRNDNNFIKAAFPTVAKRNIEYQIGNMFSVKKLVIQIHSVNGQQVFRKETGYVNGSLDVTKLAAGAYVLTISSNDYKQQFVQKFVKE
jgi:hypothetical protein